MANDSMWAAGDAYEQYMGRWSRKVAARFLDAIGAGDAARWLDVGCGVGSLTDEVVRGFAPSSVVGVDRSVAFVARAAETVPAPSAFVVGTADGLPFADGSFDVAVSGLVLNFVPQPAQALAEMARVTRAGGTVAAYVWDYDHTDFFLNRFWSALEATTGRVADADERSRWRVCDERELRRMLAASPLRDVEVDVIEVPTRFASGDEIWDGYLLGVGPTGSCAVSLADDDRARLRAWLDDRWPRADDGSVTLSARAIAFRGRV